MNTVQPIRDRRKIKVLKDQMRIKDEKYYIMLILGINVGLRISDILKLKAGDVYHTDHVTITEKKTKKTKRFILNKQMQKELDAYVDKKLLADDEYLIQSRKGENKPVTRVQAYRVLNETGKDIGIDEIGTHTMRKTFGYWHYKQYHDVAMLQDIFNHSSPKITLRYIGITQDEKDRTMEDFFL